MSRSRVRFTGIALDLRENRGLQSAITSGQSLSWNLLAFCRRNAIRQSGALGVLAEQDEWNAIRRTVNASIICLCCQFPRSVLWNRMVIRSRFF